MRRGSLPEGDRRGLERRGKVGSALTRARGQVGAMIRVPFQPWRNNPTWTTAAAGRTSAGSGDGLEAAGSADPSGAGEGGLDSAIGRPHDGEARETGGDMSGRQTASGCFRRARDQVWRRRGRRVADESRISRSRRPGRGRAEFLERTETTVGRRMPERRNDLFQTATTGGWLRGWSGARKWLCGLSWRRDGTD